MALVSKLTLNAIKGLASDKVYARGVNYYNNGSVHNRIQRGNQLNAKVDGSYPTPYHVTAELKGNGLDHSTCTCQYDWGGECKHVIAVLLAHHHEPDSFRERPQLNESLMKFSKEVLVELIEKMLLLHPDLQLQVDRLLNLDEFTQKAEEGILDTQAFRQQLRDAFNSYDYDEYDYHNRGPSISKTGTVQHVVEVAQRFAKQGDSKTALALYRTILEEFTQADTQYYHDHDGDLAYEIQQVNGHIGDTLETHTPNDTDRQTTLHAYSISSSGILISAVSTSATEQMRLSCGMFKRLIYRPFGNKSNSHATVNAIVNMGSGESRAMKPFSWI